MFAGGCTLEAAEAVLPDAGHAAGQVFDTVTALVDRSLLTTEERCGSMRYGMLESVHQFARTSAWWRSTSATSTWPPPG